MSRALLVLALVAGLRASLVGADDVVPRLTIEVAGTYLDRGRGEAGTSGLATLLLNLRPAGEKAVPYLALGGGIYHTSFDDIFRSHGPGDEWRKGGFRFDRGRLPEDPRPEARQERVSASRRPGPRRLP